MEPREIESGSYGHITPASGNDITTTIRFTLISENYQSNHKGCLDHSHVF